jgi:hypothetical protein
MRSYELALSTGVEQGSCKRILLAEHIRLSADRINLLAERSNAHKHNTIGEMIDRRTL